VTVEKPDIEALRANVGAALNAVIAVEQGDDMAYSNGSYDRARNAMLSAAQALSDALREESAE
jgi:hypothetical protein